MKKPVSAALAALAVIGGTALAFAQDEKPAAKPAAAPAQAKAAPSGKLVDEKTKASYAVGLEQGQNMKRSVTELDIDVEAFVLGMRAGLMGANPEMTKAECDEVLQGFQRKVMTMRAKKMQEQAPPEVKAAASKGQKEGEAFLAANKAKPGVVTTKSGLQYKVVTQGKGAQPKATDRVSVHYRGTLIGGKEFDSSYKRKKPATFPVNGVIPGWVEGLQLMKVGSKYQFVIPSDLAYGFEGQGEDIGPNSVLVFDVELLGIE